MNLIGHFACSAPFPLPVSLGSVLPDLLSLYGRKVRPLPLVKHWEEETGRLPGSREMVAGILFHHQVDTRFHRSSLFLNCQATLQTRMLRASRSPGLRRFFAAHILTELYFDHLLMGADPALIHDFATALDEGRDLLEAFLIRHPAVKGPVLRDFLQRLAMDRFWEDYHHHAGMFYRMNRMLARFRQRALEEPEQHAISDCFLEHEQHTARALGAFVGAMRPEVGNSRYVPEKSSFAVGAWPCLTACPPAPIQRQG